MGLWVPHLGRLGHCTAVCMWVCVSVSVFTWHVDVAHDF